MSIAPIYQESTKKNTPKGALCKYSSSFEERLLNCDALRAFLRPGLANLTTKLFQIRSIKLFLTTKISTNLK